MTKSRAFAYVTIPTLTWFCLWLAIPEDYVWIVNNIASITLLVFTVWLLALFISTHGLPEDILNHCRTIEKYHRYARDYGMMSPPLQRLQLTARNAIAKGRGSITHPSFWDMFQHPSLVYLSIIVNMHDEQRKSAKELIAAYEAYLDHYGREPKFPK
jgi:hypothetical protein